MTVLLGPPSLPVQAPVGPAAGRAPRVLVVTGSVGAGHDGAAAELALRLRAAGADVVVRDLLDALPLPARTLLRDGYSAAIARAPQVFEWIFRGMERQGALWRVEQEICALSLARLQQWAREAAPDVLVSTYPLASQALGQLVDDGRLRVPFLTYLTDPAAHASWLHPAAAAHLTVTEATAAQGRADYGGSFTVAGPLVPSRFAATPPLAALVALREQLGLRDGRPVALVATGSLGMGDVVPSTRDVAAAGWTPLVLCGRNDALRRSVAAVPGAVALGWRSDVHDLMQVADVLVHNAGGLAVTEALVAGLPAVTYRSIPGHGRANAAVLAERGGVPWPTSPWELASALDAQLARGRERREWPDAAAVVLGHVAASRLRTSPRGVAAG